MASNYRQRSGDRCDGRLIHTLPTFNKFLPFIMKTRNDAQNFYEQSLEVTSADAWLNEQKVHGYSGMGMLHLFIAAYIRCVAALPGLNRFVSGRRIYARDNIEVVMAVKRGSGINASDATVKVVFEPTDTVFDVYNKINKSIEEVKSSDEGSRTDELAEKFSKYPRFVMRFMLWLLNVADYFGLLPKKIVDASPFHGSMIISDMGLFSIGPIYRHIYNFGNIPLNISIGSKRHVFELDQIGAPVEREYVDAKYAIDERTVSAHYYATFFRYMDKIIQNPELLEVPPEMVKEDIF